MAGKSKPRSGKRGGGGSARGYRPGEVYLRPGSQASAALETLRASTIALGHAITLPVWKAAHLRRTGVSLETLDAIAFGLKKRGFARVVGGRTGALQYCAASDPQPADGVDPYDVLAEAISHACAREQSALPFERIRSLATARGLMLTEVQLRTMLEMLETTSAHRAIPQQVAARLECITGTTRHARTTRKFWRPVGTSYAAPVDRMTTRAASARAAIAESEGALERPVSPLEIRAWANAHATHPSAAIVHDAGTGARFTTVVHNLVKRDRAERGGIVDYSHPLATDGGIPQRVARSLVHPFAAATARFTDTCSQLRPVAEMAVVAALREDETIVHRGALSRLANGRVAALAGALLASIAVENGHVPREELVARTARAAERLREWWRAGAKARYPKVPRWVREAERAAEAAERLDEIVASAPTGGPHLALAGEAGLRTPASVLTMLSEILRPEGVDVHNPAMYLGGVRRFPNPNFKPRTTYSEHEEPFSLLDIGDVLLRLSELTGDGTLSTRLSSAAALLGSAVRDTRPLQALLDALPSFEVAYRYDAIVALGALGAVPATQQALSDAGDREGLDVYALSLGLTPLLPEERAIRLRGLRQSVDRPLRSWLDELVARALAGDTVTIAM